MLEKKRFQWLTKKKLDQNNTIIHNVFSFQVIMDIISIDKDVIPWNMDECWHMQIIQFANLF